ncbi:MAG: HAMP domain-containing protein [Nannocystaceae bacterium]|nr:HAMP domain-containing protein [Nannocystaceae bacterium]
MTPPPVSDGLARAAPRTSGGGLFRRIFLTFVLTVFASAAVASVGAYVFASRFNADWVAETTAKIEAAEPALVAAVHNTRALETELAKLSAELNADVAAYLRPGGRIAGTGPKRMPRPIRKRRRELRAGQSIVFRHHGPGTPNVAVMLPADDHGHAALLVVHPRQRRKWAIPVMSFSLLVAVMGAGSWVLARSLVTRLSRLQTSADRIAHGDLAHRVAANTRPIDEIDDVAASFNHMAERVELLVNGQKTLLANVSHELRTPIARIEVLLEILQERSASLAAGRGDSGEHTARIGKGMAEMVDDVDEIEALIRDLLTSGRLDLQKGDGGILSLSKIDPSEVLNRAARKVDARVIEHDVGEIEIDTMLIERLLSNLLANARRACPDGEITLECRNTGNAIVIAVEDEGGGVRPADRSAIFEPFTRLDAARDRDRGGVGLGLYLCRQIAAAHGGTIDVSNREDGGPGARFALTLPTS